MAVRDRHSSRVWPSCSLSGCGPKPVRFFCRSSEMLLASLAAITRNGGARSAFQPRLAGVFACWVRTKTCLLFLSVVLNAARVSRGYHKKWLCAIGIPAASGRGVGLLGAGQNLSAFSAGRLKCCSRLSRLSQEMAVRDRHSSRVWPGCSLSGCGPKPVRFFCRSSEMLLASLAAITRNGCARSAFQPHLAGVFAFWVRTKTCPLFAAGRLKCCSRLSWLSQEMAVRDRHSSRIGPGCSLSGCGPKPVRFFCRSSEMLLASLAAITRNGCARSAFQPHLAGVFAFWVRTKTCPLFLPVV